MDTSDKDIQLRQITFSQIVEQILSKNDMLGSNAVRDESLLGKLIHVDLSELQ